MNFDIFEIIDKLLDWTGIPEIQQDHGEAAFRLAILGVYHGAAASGNVEKAEQIKDFAVKYAGMLKDHFQLFMDAAE